MTPGERAGEVRSAVAGKAPDRHRAGRRLVLEAEPEMVADGLGQVVGVDAWVRLFDGADEVPVDPHRILVNPPTRVVDAQAERDVDGNVTRERVTREAPEEAYWAALWASVDGAPNPGRWKAPGRGREGGTVTTVFAGAADGYLQSNSATYSLARSGTGLAVDDADTILRVGQFIFGVYVIDEAFVSFDTSTIPDGDTVTAVTLDMWLTNDSSAADFIVRCKDRDWGAGLTTADWVAGADLAGVTSVAQINTAGIGAIGAYKTFTSLAPFLTANNLKTGTVGLLLSSSAHQTGTAPAGNEFVEWASADTGGTTNDPMLTITHAATPSRFPYTSTPTRVWPARS